MSREVDERVVSMQFDNKQFETNVATTMSTLDKLEAKLNFKGASKALDELDASAKNVDLSHMGNAVESIEVKFSAMSVAAIAAINRIVNKAFDAGEKLIKSLSIDQITAGWTKYADKTTAVQTILAATGESMEYVNEQLSKMNWFTDETSFNFTDMTSNVGKFTSAGVDLDKAVLAMQGIAAEAALSGQNAESASRAMYNFSQALGTGSVKVQDWMSIENANMATKEFKETIIETAKELGRVSETGEILSITSSNYSGDEFVNFSNFRSTLAAGWFDSDVLIKSLEKYGGFATKLQEITDATGTTATEMLRYVREYESGTTDIGKISRITGVSVEELSGYMETLTSKEYELGRKAFQAAQEAKTFQEAIDATKDAVSTGWMNTFEKIFGNYEEAKVIWTKLAEDFYDIFASGGENRNALLDEWNEIYDGRTILIEGLSGAMDRLIDVIGLVRDAFAAVFPPVTARNLANITYEFRRLVESFNIFEKDGETLTETGRKMQNILRGFFSIFDILKTAITSLWDAIKPLRNGVGGLFDILTDILSDAGEWLYTFSQRLKESEGLTTIVNGISNALQKITDVTKNVFSGITSLSTKFEPLKNTLSSAKDAIMDFFKSFDLFQDLSFEKLVKNGVLATLGLELAKLIKSLTGMTNGAGGFLKGMKSMFGELVDTISDFSSKVKMDEIKSIAVSIGILSVSLLILSSIEPEKMLSSVSAITMLFAELMVALKISEGFKSSGPKKMQSTMLALSVSLLLMASALKTISSIPIDSFQNAIIGITVLITELVAAESILSNQKGKNKASGFISLALALLVLSGALKVIGSMNLADIGKGLLGIGVSLGLFLGFIKLLPDKKSIVGIGAGMILLSTAILILSGALVVFGSMSLEAIGKGLLAMGGSLLIIAGAVKLLPKDLLLIGAGLAIVASSIVILSAGLAILGSMPIENVGKSLLMLGGSLLEIVLASNMMKGAIGGAAAITIVALALALLVPQLLLLGTMKTGNIAAALITLGGALAIVVAAGIAANAAVPGLLALGGAVALLGVGVLTAGAGLALLATALSTFAVTGPAGISILILAIRSLIAIIPEFITALGEGFIMFMDVLTTNLESVITFLSSAVSAVLTALIQNIPLFVEFLDLLVNTVLAKLIEWTPTIVQAAFTMLLSFLGGMRDNIQEVVETAIDIVINFIEGIASKIDDIVDAGFDLLEAFIEGIEHGINDRMPNLIQDFIGLGGELIAGIAKGLLGGVGKALSAIGSVCTSILNKAKSIFDSHSPSKEFEKIGRWNDEGLAQGLLKYSRYAENAASNVGENTMDSLRDSLSNISEAIDSDIDFSPTITPVLDLSEIQNGAKSINGIIDTNAQLSFGASANLNAISAGFNHLQMQSITPPQNVTNNYGQIITYDQLATAVKEALNGAGVFMDGVRVGNLMTVQQRRVAMQKGT